MNNAYIKQQSRLCIKNTQPSPYLAGAIFIALCLIISLLSTKLINFGIDAKTLSNYAGIIDMDAYEEYMQTRDEAAMNTYLDSITQFYDEIFAYAGDHAPSAAAAVIFGLLMMLRALLSTGYDIFALNSVKCTQPSLWNLLDGFGMFFRVLWLYILEWVFISLWTMLCVIPGIIASYSYRQAIYLLIEHPEMSALDCIRESKRLMRGHKGGLFALDLSFIGWFILTCVPYVGWAVQVWFTPYYRTAMAVYYIQRSRTPDPAQFSGYEPVL